MGPQLLWRRIKEHYIVPSEAAPRQLSWHLGRGETESSALAEMEQEWDEGGSRISSCEYIAMFLSRWSNVTNDAGH
jgi:hypothetical protein